MSLHYIDLASYMYTLYCHQFIFLLLKCCSVTCFVQFRCVVVTVLRTVLHCSQSRVRHLWLRSIYWAKHYFLVGHE